MSVLISKFRRHVLGFCLMKVLYVTSQFIFFSCKMPMQSFVPYNSCNFMLFWEDWICTMDTCTYCIQADKSSARTFINRLKINVSFIKPRAWEITWSCSLTVGNRHVVYVHAIQGVPSSPNKLRTTIFIAWNI